MIGGLLAFGCCVAAAVMEFAGKREPKIMASEIVAGIALFGLSVMK